MKRKQILILSGSVRLMAAWLTAASVHAACGDDNDSPAEFEEETDENVNTDPGGGSGGEDTDTGDRKEEGPMSNDELAASICDKWKECYPTKYPFPGDDELCAFVVKRDILESNCESFDENQAYECYDDMSIMSCGTFNPASMPGGLPESCFELCAEGDTGWIDTDMPVDTDAPDDTEDSGAGEDVVFSCDYSQDAEAPHCEEYFGSTWESAPVDMLPGLCGTGVFSEGPCPREGCFGMCEMSVAGIRMVYYGEVDPITACVGFSWTGC